MGLEPEQRTKLLLRKRELSLSGDPLKAMKLQAAIDADEMPDPSLLSGDVKTDFPLHGDVSIEIPPRVGQGSSKAAWIEFAAKVTDIDGEVLSRMKRDDIIDMLEARGNIPSK